MSHDAVILFYLPEPRWLRLFIPLPPKAFCFLARFIDMELQKGLLVVDSGNLFHFHSVLSRLEKAVYMRFVEQQRASRSRAVVEYNRQFG